MYCIPLCLFIEQGLCRRGDNCMFDHGPDPIVLDDGSIEPYQPEYRSSLGSTQPDSNSQGQEYNPEQPQLNSSKVYMPPGTDFSVPPPNLQVCSLCCNLGLGVAVVLYSKF